MNDRERQAPVDWQHEALAADYARTGEYDYMTEADLGEQLAAATKRFLPTAAVVYEHGELFADVPANRSKIGQAILDERQARQPEAETAQRFDELSEADQEALIQEAWRMSHLKGQMETARGPRW